MSHKGAILSVDDDDNLQLVIQHYLEEDGYAVSRASSGAAMQRTLESETPDVILLDLVLPDSDGVTLISAIRKKTMTPIIVVSGKSDATEKIICLEMGADDYITKPFEMRELSARVRAVIRRVRSNDAPAPTPTATRRHIRLGAFLLDGAQFQLFDDKSESMDLTIGEYRLLEALALSANQTLSREYLFSLTRPDAQYDPLDRAVDIQVARLRKKMGDSPRSPDLIKTVRGVGYMYCGPAEAIEF